MNPILKLIGEAEDFSEYEDLLALDAEQEKTLFDRPIDLTPEEAYEEAERLGEGNASESIERVIANEADYSYMYAFYVLHAPFPLGEPAIATSAEYSYRYALNVLHTPFALGEEAISTDAKYSYLYAYSVLKAPFPLGEPGVRNSRFWSVYKAHFNVP